MFASPYPDVEIPEATLYEYLFRGLGAQDLDRVALVDGTSGAETTYRELVGRIDALAGWLASHGFYPGVIERVRGLAGGPVRVVVLTTKEGRFARTLLARQGLTLGDADVFGKEARRPKRTILLELIAGGDAARVWFVEDRLRTLQDVTREPGLAGVRLFLAAWGYNTAADRAAARRDGRILLLTLARFARDFPRWVTY